MPTGEQVKINVSDSGQLSLFRTAASLFRTGASLFRTAIPIQDSCLPIQDGCQRCPEYLSVELVATLLVGFV